MAKKIYIILFIMLGFLLGLSLTFSHSNKASMIYCKKESGAKTCCKEKDSEKKGHNCDNSCAVNSCGCPATHCSSTWMVFFQTENHSLFSFSEKKLNYFYSEIFISSDFHSTWLPPKIS